MKLSQAFERIGKHTAIAVQLDNGPWVGLTVSDYEAQFSTDEDALRFAVRVAQSRKAMDDQEAERMRQYALKKRR